MHHADDFSWSCTCERGVPNFGKLLGERRRLVGFDMWAQGEARSDSSHRRHIGIKLLAVNDERRSGQVDDSSHDSVLAGVRVRAEGLEPTLLSEQEPKSCASASFATPAKSC